MAGAQDKGEISCQSKKEPHVPNPPRQGDTADRVVRFMIDQQARIEAGHRFLIDPLSHADRDLCNVVLVGLVVMLGGQSEALSVVRDLEPAVEPIRAKYEGFLDDLTSFRHDAAHASERIFREPPNRPNVNDPVDGPTRRVISYDVTTDTVTTGAGRTLRLSQAIECCGGIINEAREIAGPAQ